jgi:glycogen synthase
MVPVSKNHGEKTAVLLIAPETGRLTGDTCTLAHYISGKSGGLGDVVATLCTGLTERDIECHLATINLQKRFQKENQMDESEWRELRHSMDPEKIHLVSSSIFSDLSGAYAGNPLCSAAEFQKEMVNHLIYEIRAKNKGRLIINSHDWMAGGVITAYSRSRGCPVLHTVHNVHTGYIPQEMFYGVDLDGLANHLYVVEDQGKKCIDSHATAIKNANLINFVGKRFLHEVIKDHFIDRYIIPPAVREEVKEKYNHGAVLSIINAPSTELYPESCDTLAKKYGPEEQILAAKRINLVAFQKRTGLSENSNAILLYWPSRLDPMQKGIELLEQIAQRFVIEHGDVQIAIVGDGVESDKTHEENLGRIACASGGKITYQHFEEGLSMLGYAAANDVFGASLYEPCGQIDQIGNLFGATATNRDTGGYHDKIKELRLRMDGAERDEGNGFLFRDYDSGGLWYGLEQNAHFHRRAPEVREEQAKRIMREAREKYSIKRMIDEYIGVYEKLNGGSLLFNSNNQ